MFGILYVDMTFSITLMLCLKSQYELHCSTIVAKATKVILEF